MKADPFYAVVTTIQPPTAAMRKLAAALRRSGGRLLVVGDRKGPPSYPLPGAELLTLNQQTALPLRLPRLLPTDHYVRKNLGYLVAISRGSPCLFETDDDNAPLPAWRPRRREVSAIPVSRPGWCNVYTHFSRAFIWPRGFPLEQVARSRKPRPASRPRIVSSPVQQPITGGNPDVDALWRLLLPAPVRFARRPSLALGRGVWCPFNSQCAWWWPEAYPLLYLPSFCTFRMTDIWRSFVAQRCLWELGGAVTFHPPEMAQDRNPHDLLQDLRDEVPGYLSNGRICERLAGLPLKRGAAAVPDNLVLCYEALVRDGIFPKKELRLVNAWLADLETL